MTEGERPEIPEHLTEGLQHADEYEMDALRAYQIDDLRWHMDIAREVFDSNETVRRYVTVCRDTDAMIDRLRWRSLSKFVAPRTALSGRLLEAARLYRVGMMVLGENLEGQLHLHQLESTLDDYVDRYGLSVRQSPWAEELVGDRPYVERQGVWTRRRFYEPYPEPPWEEHGKGPTGWYWPDMPNERHDPQHMEALRQEAERQGIPGDLASFDPATHLMLSALVYGRELVRETEDVAALAPAPGLTPPAHARLRRVAGLNRLAVATIEETLRPGKLTTESVLAEVRPVIEPYGLPIKRTSGGPLDT